MAGPLVVGRSRRMDAASWYVRLGPCSAEHAEAVEDAGDAVIEAMVAGGWEIAVPPRAMAEVRGSDAVVLTRRTGECEERVLLVMTRRDAGVGPGRGEDGGGRVRADRDEAG